MVGSQAVACGLPQGESQGPLGNASFQSVENVLLVPCDTRPPTLEYVLQLGRVAGLNIKTPPLTMLNDLNVPGDTDAIAEWLLEQAPTADALIVTLETLCLGGMIPARRVTDSLEVALERLELLSELTRSSRDLRTVRVATRPDLYPRAVPSHRR